MEEFGIALTAIGALVLVLGLLSIPIERFPLLSRPIIALGLGILIGPDGLGWVNPLLWGSEPKYPNKVIEELSRLTIGIALMGVALRIPPGYFKKNIKTMFGLLGLGMAWMWLSASVLMHWVSGLPLTLSFLIGTVVTPTDPILSSTAVTGKVAEENLPERVRYAISAEAGANDGLASVFLFLPLLLLTRATSSDSLREWFLKSLVWENLGGALFGLALGVLIGRALVFAEKRQYLEKSSLLAYTLALTFLTLGFVQLIGMNSILAVFLAGIGFDHAVGERNREEEEGVQEAVNQFFTVPIFAVFGLSLPWREWFEMGWEALLLVTLILFFRRLPGILIFGRFIPALRSLKDRAFAGWFGPIGVAALYYASLAYGQTENREIWVISSLVIFSSVLVHGVSGTPLTRLYGKQDQLVPLGSR
ncbi:MAG TPA: cation:proton antiporter [Bdellovibrionota bacterium]|nr:cation:proton antiporter [Bdellovibrionota bacterium]